MFSFNISRLWKAFIVMLYWTYLMMSRKTAAREVHALHGIFLPRQACFDSQSDTQSFLFPNTLVVLFNFFPLVIFCFAFVSDLFRADTLMQLQ